MFISSYHYLHKRTIVIESFEDLSRSWLCSFTDAAYKREYLGETGQNEPFSHSWEEGNLVGWEKEVGWKKQWEMVGDRMDGE